MKNVYIINLVDSCQGHFIATAMSKRYTIHLFHAINMMLSEKNSTGLPDYRTPDVDQEELWVFSDRYN